MPLFWTPWFHWRGGVCHNGLLLTRPSSAQSSLIGASRDSVHDTPREYILFTPHIDTFLRQGRGVWVGSHMHTDRPFFLAQITRTPSPHDTH